MTDLLTSLRLAAVTVLLCAVMYPALMLLFAQALVPWRAEGSMLRDDRGRVIGSALIAQRFSRPEFFWPRPSAVDFDASATGGSNLAPTNQALAERARPILSALGTTPDHPAPAELVLASGSGVDPHITLAGALYQVDRVARARDISPDAVRALIDELAEPLWPGPNEWRLVNVLRANHELNRRFPLSAASPSN